MRKLKQTLFGLTFLLLACFPILANSDCCDIEDEMDFQGACHEWSTVNYLLQVYAENCTIWS